MTTVRTTGGVMRVPGVIKRIVPYPVRRAVRRWWPTDAAADPEQWGRSAPRWHLDVLDLTPAGATVSGWVALRDHDPVGHAPLWNGRPFAAVEPAARPDVAKALPWLTAARGWKVEGFIARTGPHPDLPAAGGWLRVEPGDPAGRPRPELGPPICLRVPAANDPPWPDPVRRQRVHGATDLDTFRRAGGTAFQRLRDALRQTCSADFTDFPRILDWGCGCGRVLRHFADLPGCRVTGVDVDADNVAWCRAHLPFAEFAAVPLHPPTPLPAAGFDLAFGVSVFTHLKEPDQFEWLTELARVVRPGGTVLATYHGEAAVATSRLSKGWYGRLHQVGILDFANEQYDAALPEADYYRNTFHTDDYIRREWGKHFEVVSLLPMWIGSQDLAVLRRR